MCENTQDICYFSGKFTVQRSAILFNLFSEKVLRFVLFLYITFLSIILKNLQYHKILIFCGKTIFEI